MFLSTDSGRIARSHPAVAFPPQSAKQRGNPKSEAEDSWEQLTIKIISCAWGPANPFRQALPYRAAQTSGEAPNQVARMLHVCVLYRTFINFTRSGILEV